MFRHLTILRSNATVLGLGIIMALAIVLSPAVHNYLPEQVVEENHQSDEKQQEAQVSTFDAVTLAIQLNLIPDQIMTEETDTDNSGPSQVRQELIEELPRKLFKILFRTIISPNAP